MEEARPPANPKSWPDYRAVWRWHFYASLFCIPFVIVLSLSGAIYLFKTEIEAWNDHPYDQLEVTSAPASAADQVRAALAAIPGARFNGYELSQAPQAAARVLVKKDGQSLRIYVHPQTLEVLHTIPESDRFMRTIFRLHGELLMGDWGSHIVELAASWTIIMILSGLYLWWPRKARGLGGVVYPRLVSGRRIFWRDLHSVTGVWISALALFLLLSGLPWAKFWGEYFKTVRRITGTAVAKQDWETGSEGGHASHRRETSDEHGDHGSHHRSGKEQASAPVDLAQLDFVATIVRPLELEHPVVIAPPQRGSSHWTAKSMTPNRPRRVDLTIDGATGAIVSRKDFGDRHLIDRLVGIGIAAHEGRLFGWPNQLLGLATAAGLVLLSVSGLILWWRRRDQGVLGAPLIGQSPQLSLKLIVLVVLLGVYLPLFGASLMLVLLTEKTVLCRIPKIRDWLGLYAPGSASVEVLNSEDESY